MEEFFIITHFTNTHSHILRQELYSHRTVNHHLVLSDFSFRPPWRPPLSLHHQDSCLVGAIESIAELQVGDRRGTKGCEDNGDRDS